MSAVLPIDVAGQGAPATRRVSFLADHHQPPLNIFLRHTRLASVPLRFDALLDLIDCISRATAASWNIANGSSPTSMIGMKSAPAAFKTVHDSQRVISGLIIFLGHKLLNVYHIWAFQAAFFEFGKIIDDHLSPSFIAILRYHIIHVLHVQLHGSICVA